MKNLRAFLVLSLGFTLLSCGGKSQYKYAEPTPGKYSSTVHKIREFVPQVDMLWIVDNSGSMSSYQQSVAQNLAGFIDQLTNIRNVRWKIGLISTSVGEGPYLGFKKGDELTYKDRNASMRFKTAISRLGINGDGVERTFQPVINVLDRYPDFLRSKAFLDLILVSDAPEQSNMTTKDFVNRLSKKVVKEKISFFGVLDPMEWCKSTDDPFHWEGSKFKELLGMVDGAAYPICAPDYSRNLIDIANRIADNTGGLPKIYLNSIPKVESIEVIYNGILLPGGPKASGGVWIYSKKGNAILFHDLDFAPGDDDQAVTVNYTDDVPAP